MVTSSHKPTVEAVTRSRKRLWWIAGGTAAGVCVVAMSGWLIVRWWTAEPWDELEQVAATFPVPEGYEPSEPFRIGERPAVCAIKPSCVNPAISMDYVPVPRGGADVCEALEASTKAWELAGFSIDQTRTTSSEVPCVVDGEIDGHTAQAFGLSAEGGGPGLTIIIWN